MIAYKFLARGALGPITLCPWPTPAGARPADWLVSPEPATLCRSGVHACRTQELAYWLHEELWRVELEGTLIDGLDCVVAPRARLLERIDAWSEAGGAQRFATAVRDHAAALIAAEIDHDARTRAQGYVDDSSWHVANGWRESPALAALCAAMGIAQLAVATNPDEQLERAYRRERAWQSAWITREMGLT